MKRKYIFLLVLIIIIIIMVVITSLILFISIKKEKKEEQEIRNVIGDQVEISEEIQLIENLQEVNIRSSYYVMKNITEKYFEFIKQYQQDTIYSKLEGEINLTEEDKRAYFNMLCTLYDEEYINRNNITDNQIQKNIQIYKQADDIKINKMYFKDINEEMTIFIAQVELLKEYKTVKENQLITARVDRKNRTFGIIPQDSEYENIEKIAKESLIDKEIEKDTYNQYNFKNIDDVEIIEDFLAKYKDAILYNRKQAYELLDEKYKEERFGDYEKFSKYIDNNIKELVALNFTEYLINNHTDYKEYICKDKYENLYIFHETSTMNYKMMLDTYTIENGTFTEKYKTSDSQYKVMMNIDKVRQMLNARDYTSIFKLLDNNFKQMYFDNNEEQFEQYMRNYFPSHYTIEFGELEKETGIFIQKVTLKDMQQDDPKDLEKIFYIDLKEGTDFIMSFNVTRH